MLKPADVEGGLKKMAFMGGKYDPLSVRGQIVERYASLLRQQATGFDRQRVDTYNDSSLYYMSQRPKFEWSEWEAAKGVQPVNDDVIVEYMWRPDDISREYFGDDLQLYQAKAGDLGWDLKSGIVSYRYQIQKP